MRAQHDRRDKRERGHPVLARTGTLLGMIVILLGLGIMLFGLMIAGGPGCFAPAALEGIVCMGGGLLACWTGWQLIGNSSTL